MTEQEMNKLKESAIERIWLVPGEDVDGSIGYLWCDCPAPSEGMEESEAVEYVRNDVFDALKKERDALAAHNQRLISGWFAVDDCEEDSNEMAEATSAMHQITQEPSFASLAAHNAWLLRKCADSLEKSGIDKEHCIATLRMNADHIDRGES